MHQFASLWVLVCTRELIEFIYKNRACWKLANHTFVQSVLWFSYLVGSNTSPTQCHFFSLITWMSNTQAQIQSCLASVPSSELCSQEEKANFMAFEVMVEILKAVKLAKRFLFHRYQGTLQGNSVSGREFLQEDSADHINSKELYCELENVPASCHVPVWSLVLYWLT